MFPVMKVSEYRQSTSAGAWALSNKRPMALTGERRLRRPFVPVLGIS